MIQLAFLALAFAALAAFGFITLTSAIVGFVLTFMFFGLIGVAARVAKLETKLKLIQIAIIGEGPSVTPDHPNVITPTFGER